MRRTMELPKIVPDYEPDSLNGLTAAQVQAHINQGKVNTQPDHLTPTVSEIIKKNTLTLFNLINLVLAIIIALVESIENTLFLGVAFANTCMGIFQELRAKRTLDKLSILAQSEVTVLRDGKKMTVPQENIVLDDILFLTTGNQICADAEVIESYGLECDESLLTGEPDTIKKEHGSSVMSGSYVTGGSAYARVSAVGEDNYATALTVEAKKEKKSNSQLMGTLQLIIRVLTIIIIPLGLLLFYSQLRGGEDMQSAVLGASASMLGMIPEGLVLLTGVTLTVGAMTLAKNKALVQSLPSIETLARADVLCLDKTGTITDGTLSFEKMELFDDFTEVAACEAISNLMQAVQDTNATAKALRSRFGESATWLVSSTTPFSSARKWSGTSFQGQGSYIIGAPGFVFPDKSFLYTDIANRYAAEGYRVLCLAHSNEMMTAGQLPSGLRCAALLIISDTIRKEAPETFRYFMEEGVTLKVISGDDPVTVSTIALKAGLPHAEEAIDMSTLAEDDDFTEIADKYTVFGRVSPAQKKGLILALKANGHTTCMTGDGVNDVPAMKSADCSVSMVGGSDAARSACDFVLMTSNFQAMVNILKEGRRVINNIETVASLYLVKTIYSVLLTILFIFLPLAYPFAPLQMTPINIFTVGIPSFIIALRANYKRPEGRFLLNIIENAVPAALIVVFNVLIIQLAGVLFELTQTETSTMIVLLTASVGFVLLTEVAKPLTIWIKLMLSGLILVFLIAFIFFGEYFMLGSLFTRNMFFYVPLLVITPQLFWKLMWLIRKGEELLSRFRTNKPA